MTGKRKSPEEWRPEWKPRKEKVTLKSLGTNTKGIAMQLIRDNLPSVTWRGGGRMTPEIVDEGIEYIRSGGTATGFAKAIGLPHPTVWRHLRADPRYEDAVEEGAECFSEVLMRLAVTPDMQTETIRTVDADGRVTVTEKTSDAVLARKLAIWAGMEWLKTRAPKKFGRKTTTEVNVTMATAIAQARKRVRTAPADVVDVEARPAGKSDEKLLSLPVPAPVPISVNVPLAAPQDADSADQEEPSLFGPEDPTDPDGDDWI